MLQVDYLNWSAPQILKAEFHNERNILIKKGMSLEDFYKQVCEMHTEYSSAAGYKRVRAAWYGTSADVFLTRFIQSIQ